MELKTMLLRNIIPYDKNPRINDKAVDAVMESIRQCGYVSPIIVDENMVILAGHTRYKALTKLGWDSVQVAVKEGLTEEQKKKYRILDNETNELAEWDFGLLAEELDVLDFHGFDFGFEDTGTDDEIDFDLDADDDSEGKIAVRFVFTDYKEYKQHENEIKSFAENVGAEMSVKSE